ncbi:MAG: cytochrome c1 [Candidatus Accumulibacter meliphilus]|jgi:ubiquinol-cytochrome c reductase cytochrome c1 subunit|uniref:Cytochrome c1 n=1 Tax=Candidatus Accumulibacter meliphilus TaxID=2211374 RepID=A0A369XJ24_9PROT|nr:MAG: cytochrome c1 [Candidatus Accumulibacter meliphilus]
MKKLLTALLVAPAIAFASGAALHLDKAPEAQRDNAALQSGARTFVNYCMNCHGLSFVRYNRLTEIGLSEQEIKDHLLFTADKIGEKMRVAARPAEQKIWFGATPPDLSLVARARASEDGSGADWLYTYLRSFYRDEKRPTGWNNLVFENVGMPHALWQLQGIQVLNSDHHLELATPGTQTPAEYDKTVADLVGFLVWAAEPDAGFRKQLGFGVLAYLLVLFGFAYKMKKNYWKDIK